MPRTTPLERLRRICLLGSDTTEVVSHGEPTFRVKGKVFAGFASASNHHGKGRDAVWCKSNLATQALLVSLHPDRIFIPPYVGHSGWIGIWLDGKVDWRMVGELIEGARKLAEQKRQRK